MSVWLDVLLDEERTEVGEREDRDGNTVILCVEKGWRVGYVKLPVSGTWRIAVRESRYEPDHVDDEHGFRDPRFVDTGIPRALTEAPRKVRAEAAPHLEALVEAVAERADRLLAGVEKAIEAARK